MLKKARVCHYSVPESSRNAVIRAVASKSAKGLNCFIHERFVTENIHLVMDLDGKVGEGFSLDDFLRTLQPLVAASWDSDNVHCVVLTATSTTSDKFSYHLHWPGVVAPISAIKDFVRWLPHPDKKYIDLQIYDHKSLRMFCSDKPAKCDEMITADRPFRFLKVCNDAGKTEQALTYTLSHHSEDVLLRVFHLTKVCAYTKPHTPAGEFASHTRFQFSSARNKERELVVATGKLNLGVKDEFVDTKALRAFNSGNTTEESVDNLVAYMNRYFAFIIWSGKPTYVAKTVASNNDHTVLDCKSKADFLECFNHIRVMVDIEGKVVERSIGTIYNEHPQKNVYARQVFNPNPPGHPDCARPNELNLFYPEGMVSQAEAEEFAAVDCSLITDHIFNVWANKDQANYDYLLDWLAHLIQKPHEKMHTSITLRGPEGVGKSSPFGSMAKILLGHYFTSISNIEEIIGQFNRILEAKILILLEEAVCEKKHASKLKALITEKTVTVERKHVDRYVLDNFVNLFMLTNDDHIVPAEGGSRRYACFNTSSEIPDKHYFEKVLTACSHRPTVLSFAHMLFNRDLDAFDRGQFYPITDLLRQQQEMTMDEVAHWWKICCEAGSHIPTSACDDFVDRDGEIWVRYVAITDLHQYYTSCNPTSPRSMKAFSFQIDKVINMTTKTVSIERKVRHYNKVSSEQKRVKYLAIATLEECREFMKRSYRNIRFEEVDDTPPQSNIDKAKAAVVNSLKRLTPDEITELLPAGELKRYAALCMKRHKQLAE